MHAVYKISSDFAEDPFSLVALHSSMEDYELVYHINLGLHAKFRRCKEDFRLSPLITFPIFEWTDERHDRNWILVTNNNISEDALIRTDLFQDEPSFTTHHLVQELKEVDYLIKILHDDMDVEEEVIKPLLRIPKMITAYAVDPDKLKSKNNLILL
jgi:hypothetical protein